MKPKFNKNNNRKPKARMTTTSFEKEFTSIADMVDEFKTLHPIFLDIFVHDHTDTPDQAAYDVVEYYLNNVPNVTTRTNLPLALTVSANKVSLKTMKFFSVEWSFNYDREGNISNLVATITVFTKEKNSEETDKLMNTLTDLWSLKETRV